MSKSHLTAIARKNASAPARWLVDQGLVPGPVYAALIRHLDYGCGRGRDADTFGWDGYDPYYAPTPPVGHYDSITCTFVLNVIESTVERKAVLRRIVSLLKDDGVAYITVRRDVKIGGYTSRGTYQENIILHDCEVVRETPGYCIYKITRNWSC